MTSQELVRRLERVRRNGNGRGWSARCPAHADRNPSLSIREQDGKILLHCHAGCTPEAICAALGVEVRDLFANNSSGIASMSKIAATYDYHDEHRTLLYQVARYIPKSFRQRRPDGKDGWISNLDGVRRVLYRLPDVLEADADSIILCEGERDVETAWQLGLVATCNPGGAGKWRPEYNEPLRGKPVAIIADADAPGVRHARDVARSLMGIASEVKLIEALPQAKDLSEWVERGGTRDRLLDLIEETPALTPADVEKWGPHKAQVPGILASDVRPEKVRWLWAGHIPLAKLTVFDGDPGLGKSTVALDLAARTTRGATLPDGKSSETPAAGAVIVSLEDGLADTIVPRLKAAGADLARIRLVQSITGADGVERTPTLPEDLPAIETAIRDVRATLLVIDPLVATLGVATNAHKDQDVRRALAPLAALAEKTGVAVVVVRHLNKAPGSNPKYRGGGSIGIIGAARASYLFGEAEDGTMVMAANKMNLCAPPASLKYALKEVEGVLVVEWLGESAHTARSLLAQPDTEEERNALTDAQAFLRDQLGRGAQPPKRVMEEARKAGISERTLRRAKRSLGVDSRKMGFGEGQPWGWELPETPAKIANAPPKIATIDHLATFDQTTEAKLLNSTPSPKVANAERLATFEPADGNAQAASASRRCQTHGTEAEFWERPPIGSGDWICGLCHPRP